MVCRKVLGIISKDMRRLRERKSCPGNPGPAFRGGRGGKKDSDA